MFEWEVEVNGVENICSADIFKKQIWVNFKKSESICLMPQPRRKLKKDCWLLDVESSDFIYIVESAEPENVESSVVYVELSAVNVESSALGCRIVIQKVESTSWVLKREK